MKKILFLRKMLMMSGAIILILFNYSCEKEPVGDRPQLPPLESWVMDFSDFEDEPGGATKSIVSYENFTHAYLNVTFWNAFTAVTLALPVTAYSNALLLSSNPAYLGDYTWEWSYDFTWSSINYVATLTGKRVSNEEFRMEMEIALKAFPNQRFKWFDGLIRYDHTHALWNLYKNDGGNSVKIIEVEWTKDYETGEGDIKYSYVEPAQNETGSYIMYEVTPGQTLDAAYTISLSTGMVNIEWNRTTKAGHVKNPAYFQDSEWHCWNESLVDVSCTL